jgi:hypothetical protein
VLLRRVAVLDQIAKPIKVGGRDGNRNPGAHATESHAASLSGISTGIQMLDAIHERGAREIFFGLLRGTTMAIQDYKPVVELDDIKRNLSVFDFAGDRDSVIDFIAGLSAKDRKVAVAALQVVDKNFAKFEKRARDAREFFSRENITTLNEFGAHGLNPIRFSIELKSKGPKRTLSINSTVNRYFVVFDAQIFEFAAKWTEIAHRKFNRTE